MVRCYSMGLSVPDRIVGKENSDVLVASAIHFSGVY